MKYFKAIADQGSINGAARELHVSQPPLSYSMNQLESELGVKLFERSPQGIELTKAGRIFYEHVEDLLGRAASAAREVSMVGKRQILRFGLTPTVVSVMAPYLCKIEKAEGTIELELYEGDTYHLKELLNDGTIDAAAIRTPVNLQGFRFMTILTESMAAVTNFPASEKDSQNISLQELSERPLIIYRRYEKFIEEAFEKNGLQFNMLCECDDARTAIQFAAEGLGTALVPEAIAQAEKPVQSYPINAKELLTDIVIAWRNNSRLINSLLEIIKRSRP